MTTHSDAREISNDLPGAANKIPTSVDWFEEIESTNDYLLANRPPLIGESRVAVAKHQTAGRGQHGRIWRSSLTSSICLSIAYTFKEKPDNLAALTLAVGASIAAVFNGLGAQDIALKWPNDLMINGAKLGGILTEIHGNNYINPTIVTGVGMNIDLRNNAPSLIDALSDREVGDLGACLPQVPGFEEMANLLIDSIHDALLEFETHGFLASKEMWRSFDWLHGKTVRISVAEDSVFGVCDGIDTDGALLLNTTDGVRRFLSGSVSVEGHADRVKTV